MFASSMVRRTATLVVLVAALASCRPKPVAAPATAPSPATAAAPAAEAVAAAKPAEVKTLLGAGATFPYPIYARWAHSYHETTGLELNYQSIGSGGGIKQIKAKSVDFCASDAPMKDDELAAAGLTQFPMVMGAVVPAVRLEGVTGTLTLDGPTLAGLYLGTIKTWNDAKIAALNPGLKLPATAVTPVYRADGSGTTWIFTHYLSKISPEWKEKVGNDKTVAWPVGVGGKGNEGVAAYIQRLDGSIGYVELAYATQNKLAIAQMKNSAGKAVAPNMASVQAAAAAADWANTPGMGVVLTDAPGAEAWPIAGASFILLYKDQPDAAKAAAMLKFFDYAYRQGGKAAQELQYVPMPAPVVELVEKAWTSQVTSKGAPVWTPAVQ